MLLVFATVLLNLDHTNGTDDHLILDIMPDQLDCADDYSRIIENIPAEFPTTGVEDRTFTLIKNFSVTSGGTYTYYINAILTSGANNDTFGWAKMWSIFIPS